MNILWLDLAQRVGKYDSWLHTDFAIVLRKYVDHLYIYAPHMHEKYDRTIVPIVYDENLRMKQIVETLGIDIVISNTRSGMYHIYHPKTLCPEKESVGPCWLPVDFADCKVPKFCIEEDFHYETDVVWHKEMGFRVLLQKHYSQSLRRLEVPCESFPFSVDTSIFNPFKVVEKVRLTHPRPNLSVRKNKICFAGSSEPTCYPQRYWAHTKLEELGLCDAFVQRNGTHLRNTAKYGVDYIDCLKEYVSHISCGSRYNLTSAKNFEIMASGSVLFTNKFTGIDLQLDEGSYITYENDWSDLVQKANMILTDPVLRENVVQRAFNCIHTRHTHEIRIKELLKLIEKYR